MVNAEKLHGEFVVAGIPISGCSQDGRIDFLPEATQEQRALAVKILAAHLPDDRERDVQEIDRVTGLLISGVAHPLCGTEETLGILRDQLVQILNAFGIEATADFARLNSIAVDAIEAARAKKETL